MLTYNPAGIEIWGCKNCSDGCSGNCNGSEITSLSELKANYDKRFNKSFEILNQKVDHIGKDLFKMAETPEFQARLQKVRQDEFDARVKQLIDNGLSKHEALTQAGLERDNRTAEEEQESKEFASLSPYQKLFIYDIKNLLLEKFPENIAWRLATRFIRDLKQLPKETLTDDESLLQVMKDTLEKYIAEKEDAERFSEIDKKARKLQKEGKSRHEALMMSVEDEIDDDTEIVLDFPTKLNNDDERVMNRAKELEKKGMSRHSALMQAGEELF